MKNHAKPPAVGAQDPEKKNSPVMEDADDDFDVLRQEIDGLDACFFNNVRYPNGDYVCSGSGELLHCENGVWVREGSCDTDNP